METRKIKNALVSVYHKTGLDEILEKLSSLRITVYSTGGTEKYIRDKGFAVSTVEDLTTYPSILSGRVKTLHPKVFGGILARREEDHQAELREYDIPEFDLVIVDLYPFEQTVVETDVEHEIIEKIDIGGISLIRAAAKNYRDVVVVSSRDQYSRLSTLLSRGNGSTTLNERRQLALEAFRLSSHYDTAIYSYFRTMLEDQVLKISMNESTELRYGENPHQSGRFYGDFAQMFEILGGKPLSYNNLVDVDAAVNLIKEFLDSPPTFAVLKHTNACGLATCETVLGAWKSALAGDPVSAFGGVLIANCEIDLATAQQIDTIFYEVLIAPAYAKDALKHLQKKKKRIILRAKHFDLQNSMVKTLLNGYIQQDADVLTERPSDLQSVTKVEPTPEQIKDLIFANKAVKHLKSNTIVLARNEQLLGMGCGQTSRVDALKQAIHKAQAFDFDLTGAVLASDAFFPFPDCVEIGAAAGIVAVIQPGGSIRDQDSIDMADDKKVSMVLTGRRHFKH